MLNHAILKYDALGRIRSTLDPPEGFNGGTPVKDGLLCITFLNPDTYANGFGYRGENICSEQGLNPPVGNPMTGGDGRTRTTTDSPPAYWYCGLPFAANGLLTVAPAEGPPVQTSGFTNGFDAGFK